MKTKIVYKIIFPFAVIFIIALLFLINMIHQSQKVVDTGEKLEQLTLKQESLFKIRDEVSRLLMDVNDYIITQKVHYKNGFNQRISTLQLALSIQEISLFNSSEKSKIEEIKTILGETIVSGKNILEEVDKNNLKAAANLMEKFDYVFGDSVFKKLDQLIFSISDEIKSTRKMTEQYRGELLQRLIISGISVLIISIITTFLTVRYISKPISSLTSEAVKIAKGNYAVQPNVRTHDEIRLLADTFTKMAETIRYKEEALQESRMFMESIVRTIPSALLVIRKGGAVMTNPDTFGKSKIVHVNQTFCKMFDTTEEKVIGREVKNVLSEISLSNFCQKIVMDGKTVENVQCECSLPSKRKLSLNLSLTGFDMNEKNVLIVMHDITELKEAEKIILLERDKVKLYFEIAEVIMLVLDEQGCIAMINRKGKNILGYSGDEILGMEWFSNFIKSDDRDKMMKIFESLINGKDEILEYFENEIITRAGEERIIEWRNAVLKDVGGKIIGTLSSGIDITEKRKAELLFAKYTEELKAMNAQKDKFFSILSHDLRSPFHGLLGYADLLANDVEILSKKEVEEYSKAILLISQKVYEHLNSLLEWARLQRNKIDFNPTRININALIEYVVSLLKPNADKKQISLSSELQSEIFIHADKYMITSVLQNLLSNSIKFTPKNGRIIIATSLESGHTQITITDNGVGMTGDDINNVFRVDKTFSTKGTEDEHGTGLGLVICKEMIERHGGKISIASKPGEGTSIKFSVPLSE